MKQFQITYRPRHIRYLYFIDEHYSYEKLFILIYDNLRIWGGRYNPIIPVYKNSIPDKYKTLLTYYDPDFIFYSDGVDPEIIKKLRIFNPSGYFNLDETPPKENILGIDAFYFLSKYDTSSKILMPRELWKTNSPLLDYYKLNFGIDTDASFSDYEIGKHHTQIIVDPNNFESLNQIILHEGPIIKSNLSRLNINTRILRTKHQTQRSEFEIVIAKDKSSTLDLLYYWNRLLYEGDNVFYLTVEELNLLSADKFFGAIFFELSHDDTIRVVSMTLTKEEIEELIKEKLAPISIHRRFQFKDIQDFPFEVLDADGLYERDYGESFSTQSIISDKGLFHLPKLSFTNEVGFHSQKWAIDVNIKKFGGNEYHNEIQLPYSTDTHSFIKGVKGRVNRKRNITIFVHNQQNTSENIEINILDFNTLLSHLIIDPVINGTKVKTKYLYMGPHDSSKKLFAFLKSFNFDFDTIDDFFSDIFWVKLFEYLTLNTKKAGDSIYFDELKLRAIDALKQKGVILGEKEKTYENEENLEIGLKETLKELCSYRVFLKGFKLKCNKCSSNFWYPLKEISETVTCKGCMLKFKLPIEPKFAYKLNDLIKNNIFQSQKEYDGNLTVIRTLVYIYDNCRQSFEYNPQINLFDKIGINKPCSEIDIVCTSDGKFIIGEAKHNSSAFSEDNNKSLKSLVDIAKEIYPDKIIISCTEDDKGRLDKAKKRLMIYFNGWEYMPEIETIVLDPPNDFSLGGHRYFYY